jgi:RNA recognition motif-containing protein
LLRSDRTEKKIYLRGITEELIEGDLERFFRQFGAVLHVQIGKYQFTNHYKGFGFIEFANKEAVEKVLAKKRYLVKGVEISCERSKLNNPSSRSFQVTQEQASKERSSDLLSNSQARNSQDCKKQNYRQHQNHLKFDMIADHFKPFTHSVDKVASNHTESNLMFRIPFGAF